MTTALESAALAYASSLGWGAGGSGPLVWPSPANCIAGKKPSPIPSMISSEQDLTYYAARNVYFDRMSAAVPDGAVLLIGDSHVEGMAAPAVCPFAINMGIGGDTMRGVLNRLDRASAVGNPLSRAGAGVLLIGINDLCFEAGNYFINITYMLDMLSAWLTGRWVICQILPINETMFQGTTNARIDAINTAIAQRFGARDRVCVVDVKSSLAPSGQLQPQYTTDGLHLTAAGCAILMPAISASLRDLGLAW